jgi:hypothetical protein
MSKASLAFAVVLATAALAFAPSVASGANVTCTGVVTGTVNGNVSAGPGCVLNGAHATGNVSTQSNGSLTSTNSTIDGNVEIKGTTGANSICGTTIGGNLQVHNNTGTTTIDGSCGDNSVGGNVEIHNNTGPVTISHTAVDGNLKCHDDTPAASTGDGGNTVAKKTDGECTTSTTVDCPSTGCTATASDGNTSATVTVPGGGKSGKLTVTLVPPLPDDGCIDDEEESSGNSGDIVIVDPPKGYGPDNPITVEISYSESSGLFAICKSDNGKVPFTELPMCTDENEDSQPDNVPCWEYFGEGNNARVFITSVDPQISGHA